ncbi:MAG: large-conductance mechanosensitive channel [Phycisphaerae bacterium]|nr:MAG: large-conductance mechanosensitive channel [Phycisphaerae bacterium]
MGMMKEFKEFAMRGNVMDMAIGIILGGASGKIVSSLVKDVIMPPIGILLGGVDFSSLSMTIKDAVPASEGVEAVEAITLNYGVFINTIVDFLIVAFAIFMAIKVMNTAMRKKEEEPKPAGPSKEEVLLGEIRDLLKAKS